MVQDDSNGKLLENWDQFWESQVKSIEGEIAYSLGSAHGRLTLGELTAFPGGRVLEAGCGLGNWLSILQTKGYHPFGVDIAESSLRVAKKFCGDSAVVWQGDIRMLACADASFDTIISFGVIEHFPDSFRAVQEFYRVLRPGGCCIVTTPNPWCFHGLIGRHILNLTRSRALGYTGYENSFTPNQLAHLEEKAGFVGIRRGLLPEGYVFGMFWPLIPVIGRPLCSGIRRLSLLIERNQNLIGTGSYAVGFKP